MDRARHGRLRAHGARLLLWAALAAPTPCLAEGIAIITHPTSRLATLDKSQLSDLYLGRKRALAGDQYIELYDHPINSRLRARFFARLNGMSLSQVNAYWARLQFTGRVYPPVQLDGDRELIETVRSHKNAIAYVDGDSLTTDVKVLLWLE